MATWVDGHEPAAAARASGPAPRALHARTDDLPRTRSLAARRHLPRIGVRKGTECQAKLRREARRRRRLGGRASRRRRLVEVRSLPLRPVLIRHLGQVSGLMSLGQAGCLPLASIIAESPGNGHPVPGVCHCGFADLFEIEGTSAIPLLGKSRSAGLEACRRGNGKPAATPRTTVTAAPGQRSRKVP